MRSTRNVSPKVLLASMMDHSKAYRCTFGVSSTGTLSSEKIKAMSTNIFIHFKVVHRPTEKEVETKVLHFQVKVSTEDSDLRWFFLYKNTVKNTMKVAVASTVSVKHKIVA